MEPRLYLLD